MRPINKSKARSSVLISLVAAFGLVLAMLAAPASADTGAGEITFTGTAHLPVFPDNINSTADGKFYGQIAKAELAGVDGTGAPWSVEGGSNPLGDNDIFAQFDYSEDNCEVGEATGAGWIYLSTAQGDNLVGATSIYAEFDFTWNRIGTTANITLTNVDAWLDVPAPASDPSEASHGDVGDPTDPSSGHVITGHGGLGEAVFAPTDPVFVAEACPENATAGDLHAEVVGEAQILTD